MIKIVFRVAGLILLFVALGFTCQKGYIPSDTPGVCVEAPALPVENPAWVSDEKPPSDKMPSYEREGIKILNVPRGVEPSTTTAHDYQAESNGK